SIPHGFVAVGDALCTFNPIYAQGMSAAARQAAILGEVLSKLASQFKDVAEVGPAFFARAAEFNATPWNLAAAFDFAYPQTRATRPVGYDERVRYFAALDRLQTDDPEIRRLMTEVFHLLQPLSVLLQEPVRRKVLARAAL